MSTQGVSLLYSFQQSVDAALYAALLVTGARKGRWSRPSVLWHTQIYIYIYAHIYTLASPKRYSFGSISVVRWAIVGLMSFLLLWNRVPVATCRFFPVEQGAPATRLPQGQYKQLPTKHATSASRSPQSCKNVQSSPRNGQLRLLADRPHPHCGHRPPCGPDDRAEAVMRGRD